MRWILRLRVYVIIFLAVVLISAAVIFSVLRAVLPHATGYKNEIQREISRQIGLPVEIDSIDAAIHWFSPRLKLLDVTVYDKENKVPLFNFKEAFVQLDVVASVLRRDFIVDDVGLVGADISIEKLSENEWLVQGIKISSEGKSELPDAFLYMLKNSDYLLHDSNIYYRDHTGEKLSLNLLDVNIDVNNSFDHHDIKFSMNLPDEYGHDLAVVANLSGDFDSLDGDIFIDAHQVKLKQWSKKFKLLPDFQIDTTLDINVWLTVEGNAVKALTSQFTASNLAIKNKLTSKSWGTEYLSTSVRYVNDKDHWNVAVADFYFSENSQPVWPQLTNIIASEDDNNFYLSANFIRVDDLQDMVQVFLGKEKLSDFEELKKYKVNGDVYNLSLLLPKAVFDQQPDQSLSDGNQPDEEQADAKRPNARRSNANRLDTEQPNELPPGIEQPELNQEKNGALVENKPDKQKPGKQEAGKQWLDDLTLQASLVDFAVNDAKGEIHLSGLDAFVKYEKRQAILDLASQDTVFEAHKLFRDPLFATTLRGEIRLNYDGTAWVISSEKVQLKNDHINTFSRVDVRVAAAEDIFFDVQTDFYDAYGKYARYYLPVGVMSPALIEWLDMAVVDGHVPTGQFILHGDLNSFPYDNNDGVFQVLFFPSDVSLRFLKDWPLITDVSATVKFSNKSLHVKNARGKTRGADLFNGHAEIPDLMHSYLTVVTDARSKNEDVQAYIWNSPLDDALGDAMRLFQFTGESKLNLKIEVPIAEDDVDVTFDGHLKFKNTEIYYSALGYEISDINGTIDFTKDSIFADSMQAKIQGESVSINAFTRKGKSGPEVVYHLDGVLTADYLLQHYDWIPENWISGKSTWALDIEVPFQPEDYLIHIKTNSYLDGVSVQVSDKVQKSPAAKVNFSTAIDVLDNNGLHVDAKADVVDSEGVAENIFEVYAVRDENLLWKFDIDSGYMTGKGKFTEGLGKDTEIKLDLQNIDLHALFYTETEDGSDPLRPDNFPPLSWRFDKLLWDDWVLRDVVLETDWHKHGMLINKFSLKGPAMTFDARGSWLKSWRGSQETVLQGTITSKNIGETLMGLGFERSVNRGKSTAKFNAKWPAAPYSLSWAIMKGKTSFEIENGEILEVEPGAGGRLLGLLNIFKLTSRLAFDFDDVTRKGFSFDYIKGEFEFVNGDGSLKNFDVSAAAADVNIFGSIGLVKHDYGLLMRVKPHTDTLTFAGGVLLGGVAVGAGLALIQKVFDLGVLGHNVYSITGSWDDPKIEKIIERTPDADEEDDF